MMRFGFTYDGKEYVLEAKGTYRIAPELLVEVERREIREFDAVQWTVWFSDPSDRNSAILSDIHDCDTSFPFDNSRPPVGEQPSEGDLSVTSMHGMVYGVDCYDLGGEDIADEYRLKTDYFGGRKRVKTFENVGGRSSQGTAPFFRLDRKGEGVVIAIGWTGDWRATFTPSDKAIDVRTGLKNTHFYLEPGEKIRTSSVLVMKYGNGDWSNKFRRLIRTHFSHTAGRPEQKEGLFAAELWGAMESEEMCRRIERMQKHGIPFEELWIDAAWYGDAPKTCASAFDCGWAEYTGDWRIGTETHPDGLLDVKKVLDEKGQRLMLWFEPERVAAASAERVKIYREHPEWLLEIPDWGDKILYYGAPGAVDYVFGVISDYVERLDLGCYRQDFNSDLTATFAAYEPADRRGIFEIKHIMGVYELFDRLLARFPRLAIDNCASGGRRIDIEMLSRSIAFFRTDYLCEFNGTPEILQTHNTNVSALLPYTGCPLHMPPDVYTYRSGYSSSFGFMCYSSLILDRTDEELDLLGAISKEYLRVRGYFSKDFYNHGSSKFDRTSWAIWQYHDPDSESGIVLAFRRPESPFAEAEIELKGVDPSKELTVESFDGAGTFRARGKLAISLPEKRSSALFLYRAK